MQVTLGQSREIPCPHQLGFEPRANGYECKAIGFIILAGPENRGSSKVWSLSWTSVFLPVGAGVFVLTGQSTWAYGDSAWRKGSLLRQAWKCVWAWKEACFAQISYPALVPPFPHMFVLDLPLLFWNGAAAFLKYLVRNSLLFRRPRSDTVTEQMGAGHARKLGLTLSRRLLSKQLAECHFMRPQSKVCWCSHEAWGPVPCTEVWGYSSAVLGSRGVGRMWVDWKKAVQSGNRLILHPRGQSELCPQQNSYFPVQY